MSVRLIRLAALLLVHRRDRVRVQPQEAARRPADAAAAVGHHEHGCAAASAGAAARARAAVASVPAEPAISGTAVDYNARSLDELNRESPLQPVFYTYDSADVAADMQAPCRRTPRSCGSIRAGW